MSGLESLLEQWRTDPTIHGNISAWKIIPSRKAEFCPYPENLHPAIKIGLNKVGISALYAHQAKSYKLVQRGENITISTGTASGKTLCYNLPIIDHLLNNEKSRALYLFPTKALAQDQLAVINKLLDLVQDTGGSNDNSPAILPLTYDGDTSPSSRLSIRKKSRLILSNPDMLHMGILPNHPKWASFFQGLRFIVIDEMHTYRGVFGSHVANVIRRAKRIANFYGGNPQYVLTSATIGNPQELAESLIEEPVIVIDEDGSERGEKHFLLYNPPVIDPELGVRTPMFQEILRLLEEVLTRGIQTIVFGRSRRSVEVMLSNIRDLASNMNLMNGKTENSIRAYRSGYLPKQRREIEVGLRQGSVKTVIATTALELGIDIGQMEVAILAGYPGTIAGTWQQSGRAGRNQETSLAVLVASGNLVDQFLANKPDYFFGQKPEIALIDSNNLLILLDHLKCALYELPFDFNDTYGNLNPKATMDFLELLNIKGEAYKSGDKYFWMSDRNPAMSFSLRNVTSSRFLLQDISSTTKTTIGEIDGESVFWMVHPNAIYLHEGDKFLVNDLDLEQKVVRLQPIMVDYFTRPKEETEINILGSMSSESVVGATKSFGEISLTTQIVGYQIIKQGSLDLLGYRELSLPQSTLHTYAYWIMINASTVNRLRNVGLWKSERNKYGSSWKTQREKARERDKYTCKLCGKQESGTAFHVHHKNPFRKFTTHLEANVLTNLITLCPVCHRRVESRVRIRSSIAGLGYIIGNLVPLFVMCDTRDIGVIQDAKSSFNNENPLIAIYDKIPGGIGFSHRLYNKHDDLLRDSLDLASNCKCMDGCPSCVGPGGELGDGSKSETIALLNCLLS